MTIPPLLDVLRHLRSSAVAVQHADWSDSQLLQRFVAERDQDAFAALLLRHGPLVLGVTRRLLRNAHLAEEAFQAAFLVLARKAGSIQRHASLAAWLHRVALNIAQTARTAEAQRRTHEREAGSMSQAYRVEEGAWHDWQPVLHEEVNRLPAKYRVPVVLCYLAGKTNEEAARELGWPLGTVKGRLSRARHLLRTRLARRGLTLSASGVVTWLTESPVAGALPAALAETTLTAAMQFAAGIAAPPAGASASTILLAQGALKTMTQVRLLLLTLFVLLAGFIAGGSLLALRSLADAPRNDQAEQAAPKPPALKPVGGLKLTLSADKAQTVMNAEGSNAEPVKLQFTFTNVGDKPLKLDMSPLPYLVGTELEVTGPDPKSVRFVRKEAEFQLRAARAEDFHLLKPGEKWTRTIHFPTEEFCWGHYYLLKPGEYRIRATYKLPKESPTPLAKGSWTGTVFSNPFVLKVLRNPEPDRGGPWGKAVDGMAARLVAQPRYVIGQPIATVIEVKNTSDRKRYLVPRLDPHDKEKLAVEITGPKGKVRQTAYGGYGNELGENMFQPIGPGEVKRFEVLDLSDYFLDLKAWQSYPARKANSVPTGKYTLQFKFRSPKVPPRFIAAQNHPADVPFAIYKDAPAEMVAGQWAGEVASAPVTFELAPLGKEDLVVHEWGVFTVFNDVKYANVNRKEEWGSLPSFFYRQFPKERLRWVPSAWDKPIVYFYARPTPLHLNVKVTFTEGAPVVWWPAAVAPVDDWPGSQLLKQPRPFRSLVWDAWLGDKVPIKIKGKPLDKVTDFALPADCWLKHARLPSASRLTVTGNIEGQPTKRFPGALDRSETERFLYYDGLVPAPDYLRCEKAEARSLTLRNRAKFDITRLFVVDRHIKGSVGFAFVDGKKQTLKAGTTLKIEPKAIAPDQWPAVGHKQVRQALLEAGLFEAEADALLKIWQTRFLEAEGVTVFHILPAREYDRMLPLDVMPAPALKPVRVGIALHPHVEIEPVLAEQVGALIRQLDDPKFQKRAAASKALLEIGPLAIALLRAELKKDPTLEMRRRIEAVLERVDAADWLNVPGMVKKPGNK
jgi:RNA polymerase sigma factor (sigma-70 family)